MGPSNGKYKSMYFNESEVGVGNSCKLSRRVYFGLFHVVHKCLSEITLTYALKPVVLCLCDATHRIDVFNSILGWKLQILILLQFCLFPLQ
jgi:hypothetical protein